MMGFVPSQSLQNLLCIKCKKYLSYFPIHDSLQPNGSICGRCPLEDDDQRNTVYEELAKLQRFPCCYDSSGCTEILLPINIPQHERFCYFRKYYCPSASSTNCKWQGLADELLDHFEKYHRIFLLNTEGFEVDFVTKYNEHCLLNFENSLFVVNRANDPKSATMSYNVSYVGTNTHADEYMYKIILCCPENKSRAHIITNQLSVNTDIKRDSILNILHNPNTVIVRIEINKPKDADDSVKYSDVNTELLRELECSDCFEYMLPPIQQCITGHSICSNCKTKHSECPTCKAEFNDTINITLGHLIDHLIYPCKNEGCKFTCKAKDIKEHEKNCIFGLFKCPLSEYENCNVKVHYVKLYDHILDNHYENLLELGAVHMPFQFTEEDSDEDCYILRHNFQLFKLHYLYKEGTFHWAMQLIGAQGKNINQKFDIVIVDNSNNNCKVHFRARCSPESDKATAFGSQNCISLNYQQIKGMITDGFSYKVHIVTETEH